MRANNAIRKLVRETTVTPANLIYPLFITFGKNKREEIGSMPGNYRISADLVSAEAREIASLGIPAVILFGIPEHKDEQGSSSWDPDGVVQRAVKEIKNSVPDLLVITDVCIDEYASHGHCGLVKDGKILNDETLPLFGKMALSHARAGADIVAPSDMMDGRVAHIRQTLDAEGFKDTAIMAYSAKYASGFYGPFRDACDSAPQFGDRGSYQMDPANTDEAIREVYLDIVENADIVMVKPALPYLDIIRRIRDFRMVDPRFNLPIAAYNVSGEYSMLVAAAEKGWLDLDRVMLESLLSIRRAGANMILTYFAKKAARLLGA